MLVFDTGRVELCCCAKQQDGDESDTDVPPKREEKPKAAGGARKRKADSTDFVASALTRRFGLAGGLVWLGILAFGVVSEQIKTRREIAEEEAGTKDIDEAARVEKEIPGTGIRYSDKKQGGGASPRQGNLVVVSFKGYENGRLFVDTYDTGKPIVFIYKSRPFTGGMCQGLEMAMETMKAGGKRHVTIPPQYGFGENGIALKPTLHVPEKQGVVSPGALLEYDMELVRVSIPPS